MRDTELLLFSGGPDSTILLKDLLQKKKKVRVLYIEMGWAMRTQYRIDLQNKAVENILGYIKSNYGDFNYSQARILTTMDEENEENYFGTDDQWCAFFGAMFCKTYNIKRMWTGNFSCTEQVVRERDNKTQEWLYNESMKPYLDAGAMFSGDCEYCTPKSVYNGTDIDRFKTKKEAWDSLEIELKNMVRSCTSDKLFCGKCSKCWTALNYKLRDESGNPL
jgi:hypothetical protein